MFRFILEKMWSKRWMMLALLIGNILFISTTCANAMYGQASLQRTLTKNLQAFYEENSAYPGLASISVKGTVKSKSIKDNGSLAKAEEIIHAMAETQDLPVVQQLEHYVFGPTSAEEEVKRAQGIPSQVSVGTMTGMSDHVEIVAGEMYSSTPDADGVVDVMVSEWGLVQMNIILGQEIQFPKYILPSGEPLTVRVTGVFKNSQEDDLYWVRTPASFKKEVLMHEDVFRELFLEGDINDTIDLQMYVLMDYQAIKGNDAQRIYSQALRYNVQVPALDSGRHLVYRDNFSGVLGQFLPLSKKVNMTLWVLQVPNFILLAAFIFMVSRQMLDLETNEIAVIKSRGASRAQLIITYLLQSITIAALAMVAGIPLGMFLVQVLGSANAFMEFVSRGALPVELSLKVLLYTLAAALLSIAAMVLPVFRHSSVTIVNHKQKKARRSAAPLWQRLFLDVVILGVSLYGLYTYNSQKDQLAQRVLEDQALDPLLFICSSLFMIGAGLVALRILPLITKLVFYITRRWLSPSLYTAFLQVIRTRYSQSFIMVFLVMTIAMGIFNAQAARTINTNEEENIAYTTGADIVLRDRWSSVGGTTVESLEEDARSPGGDDNLPSFAKGPSIIFTEPDFAVYQNMEGVANVTRVLVDDQVTVGDLKDIKLMGIHTKTFGETAWFKNELLPHHFYEYLNAMADDPLAVLLSSNFRDEQGYELGDFIYYKGTSDEGHNVTVRGVVYGFVDYWPTFSPYSFTKGIDGVYRQTDNYLIVANLAQLQAAWGVTPYQVWIDAEDSTSFIYDYAVENGKSFSLFEDTSAQIVTLKNDPVFQGTNGILTVGFIVVLLLCAVGFLIYWILSIQSRALQFGIYRAMGMSMGEIVTMLLGEQVFISATSIVTGIGVGVLTSKLYMPLIQMAYAAYDSPLPLRVISAPEDMIRLMIVIGVMILACMGILGWLISRMKIAQVLKLGED